MTRLQGRPTEEIVYDLKKLSGEKIRMVRDILAEAAVSEAENRE